MTRQIETKDDTMDDLLADFARGALDRGTELLVETWSTLKDDVAQTVSDYEAVGGDLLETIEPTPLRAGALDAVLSLIDTEGDAAQKSSNVPPSPNSTKWQDDLAKLPHPLREIAADGLTRAKWRVRGRGIRGLDLSFIDPDRSGAIELYRIEPGCAVPRHGHEGEELTLVITGAFRDDAGRHGPGDVALGGADITHQPVAEDGEVCLALAVTTAPLKMTGALGLVQRALARPDKPKS